MLRLRYLQIRYSQYFICEVYPSLTCSIPILAEWLESVANEMPVNVLPAAEVIALTEHHLSAERQTALSELLAQNRENKLDDEGRRKLDELLRVYEHGLLRKA